MDFDEDVSQNYIDEAQAPSSKQDFILRSGLAKEPNKIAYYRRVLKDPARAAYDPNLRQYSGELLQTLLGLLFSDPTIWNRTKTLLNRSGKVSSLREDVTERGFVSLVKKSEKHEVPLETILEVYSRGAKVAGEKGGFERVNSFLAGGRARELDSDLTESRVEKSAKHMATLELARRIIKEGRKK